MTAVQEIVCGDALDLLRQLRDGSVHACITSPPYWGKLRDYKVGEAVPLGHERTPEEYVERLVEIFREVRRVLRDDGVLWINIGDCYASSGGAANGGHDGGFLADRPNGAGTRGRSRVAGISGLKGKDLVGVPWMTAFALRRDGWYLRNDALWPKLNGMPYSGTDRLTMSHEYLFMLAKGPDYFYDVDAARKPSVMKPQRRTKNHKPRSLDGTLPPHTFSTTAVRDEPAVDCDPAGRQRRTSDVWREGLDMMIEHLTAVRDGGGALVDEDGVVGVLSAVGGFKGAHFAVFPERLVEPLVRLSTSERGVCPTCAAPWKRIVSRTAMVVRPSERREEAHAAGAGGGRTMLSGTMLAPPTTTGWESTCACEGEPVSAIVVDPFSGSGTVGVVTKRLGRSFLGFDLNEDYCEMARKRIAEAK